MALGWYLKDEEDRAYNLSALAGLHENEAVVPFLWLYEVSNGRSTGLRKVLELQALALKQQLTVYDASYLELAIRSKLPIATKDNALKRAMAACGIKTVEP